MVSARKGARALRRLLLLSYVPRGFWARLCARVLADPALALLAPALYCAPREVSVRGGGGGAGRRLLLLSYVPRGFWAM